MRLFMREQRPLIAVYALQLLVITLVYWLDGYRHWTISLYAALLSTCLLAAYLVFRYVTNRSFYRRLEERARRFAGLAKQSRARRCPTVCSSC
ncbi:hypothetical protein HMSSN036_52800 [Paenibacillus macerans]|nr:hypothetical protein HMSSN036_52800 [Paenibacillus macerans]